MADAYLDVPLDKIHIVPLGLNIDGHGLPVEKTGTATLSLSAIWRVSALKKGYTS